MKDRGMRYIRSAAVLLALLLSVTIAHGAVPERINYQGYLTDDGGKPIYSPVSMTFRVYTVASGGTPLWTETQTVTPDKGVYSVVLGSTTPLFLDYTTNSQYYLGVQVGDDAEEMTPRQVLTSVGSSHTADTALDLVCKNCVSTSDVDSSAIQMRVTGTCPAGSSIRIIDETGAVTCEADTSGSPSDTVSTLDGAAVSGVMKEYSRGDHKHGIGAGAITSTHILNGTVTATDVNDTSIQRRVTGSCSAGSSIQGINQDGTVVCEADSVGWSLTGNAGTIPSANFIGTTDNVRLHFRVNNEVVFRLIPDAKSPNIIGGRSSITTGVYGATIGGGGESGYENLVTDYYGTIGGGRNNQAGDNAGTVSDKQYATVGGGNYNTASGDAATVGGGYFNTASGDYSTVGGGNYNDASGSHATVGGGNDNTASGDAATVGGGYDNTASGDYSFAIGGVAKALNNGCFVWGDSNVTKQNCTPIGCFPVANPVTCDVENRWVARASGGVYFYTNSDLTSGVRVLAGGGSWASVSDRNLKENFSSVDGKTVLDRLSEIPVTTWNYKSQDSSIRHMGPVAQDFSAAFGLGEDDKFLNTIDVDGVALAAIQGLYQMTRERDEKIDKIERENKELKEAIGEIKRQLMVMAVANGNFGTHETSLAKCEK